MNDNLNDAKQRKKAALFKLLLMFSFITAVFVFLTAAWFASNRSVSADGMSVTVGDLPFEIGAKGNTVRNSTEMQSVNADYQEGVTMYVDEGDPLVTNTYYKTSSSIDKLKLRFDLVQDDPETTDVNESNDKSIGPGSCGTLGLYIIPKKDGSLSANIKMEVIGYVEADVYKTSVNEETNETVTTTEKKLVRISDLSPSACTLTQAEINKIKQAESFLQGHIMFFDGLSNSPASYSYIHPCIDRTTRYEGNNLSADQPYYKPIYWMWPNTLGQIAVKDNSNGKRVGIPVVEETTNMGTDSAPTDKALVLKYLRDNKQDVFKNLENVASLTEEEIESAEDIDSLIDSKINARIADASNEDNFKKLTNGYNTADYDIGSLIDYFVVEVTVSDGS